MPEGRLALTGRQEVARRFRDQADTATRNGSPLYRQLLTRAAQDVDESGLLWQVLEPLAGEPAGSNLPLRLMAAVHRLVLTGRAPDLAAHYPSVGGTPGPEVWGRFEDAVRSHRAELPGLLALPLQTNEVGRAAALLGGFLLAARETGLPLRVLELGASAGLNLRWDRFRIESTAGSWGDPQSPVRIEGSFAHGTPPLETTVRVVERRGCDVQPLDPNTESTALALTSCVWADQVGRIARLRGAIALARSVPAPVDRAHAPDWLALHAVPRNGVTTVVFHSIVMQYLAPEARSQVVSTLRALGAAATPSAPLAWLTMEPNGPHAEITLTVWPGGERRVLATAPFHGPPVRWLA